MDLSFFFPPQSNFLSFQTGFAALKVKQEHQSKEGNRTCSLFFFAPRLLCCRRTIIQNKKLSPSVPSLLLKLNLKECVVRGAENGQCCRLCYLRSGNALCDITMGRFPEQRENRRTKQKTECLRRASRRINRWAFSHRASDFC